MPDPKDSAAEGMEGAELLLAGGVSEAACGQKTNVVCGGHVAGFRCLGV